MGGIKIRRWMGERIFPSYRLPAHHAADEAWTGEGRGPACPQPLLDAACEPPVSQCPFHAGDRASAVTDFNPCGNGIGRQCGALPFASGIGHNTRPAGRCSAETGDRPFRYMKMNKNSFVRISTAYKIHIQAVSAVSVSRPLFQSNCNQYGFDSGFDIDTRRTPPFTRVRRRRRFHGASARAAAGGARA